MFCPYAPLGVHSLKTPLTKQNVRYCPLCNKWMLSSREKIVHLPPPAALAASAPVRQPDAGLGEVVAFARG